MVKEDVLALVDQGLMLPFRAKVFIRGPRPILFAWAVVTWVAIGAM